MGRSRRKKRRSPLGGYILLFAILFLFGYSMYSWQVVITPALDGIAEIKAEAMVAQLVTKAMNEQFKEESDATELLIIKTNNEGNIEMVQSNTKAINLLITELAKEVEERYSKLEPTVVEVPIGSVFGSKLLSQAGPDVEIKIQPIGVAGMDFRTEFETQGINQTKYKVYAILESRVRMLAPFSSETMKLKNTVLVAEAVILGKVPSSYVVVPEEDILDVTKE